MSSFVDMLINKLESDRERLDSNPSAFRVAERYAREVAVEMALKKSKGRVQGASELLGFSKTSVRGMIDVFGLRHLVDSDNRANKSSIPFDVRLGISKDEFVALILSNNLSNHEAVKKSGLNHAYIRNSLNKLFGFRNRVDAMDYAGLPYTYEIFLGIRDELGGYAQTSKYLDDVFNGNSIAAYINSKSKNCRRYDFIYRKARELGLYQECFNIDVIIAKLPIT